MTQPASQPIVCTPLPAIAITNSDAIWEPAVQDKPSFYRQEAAGINQSAVAVRSHDF
jgi:hypothetical protein